MQGVAWHMWALILYLKRHDIPVTKPNDTAMFNLVRGMKKWAFLKTCVVNGTHATKTSTVLNALKKATVANNPSIFTDDVARGLAKGPPAASHGGEATGVARAGSWNFEDVFQEADTLELTPPLGKPEPEPEIKDSANNYSMFKRFFEDETMMLRMIEFVGSLELKCCCQDHVKLHGVLQCPCEAAKWLARSLAGPFRELGDVRACGLHVVCRSCETVRVRSAYSASQACH